MQISSWPSSHDPGLPNYRLNSIVANFQGGWGQEETKIFMAQIHLMCKVCNTKTAALRKEYIMHKHGWKDEMVQTDYPEREFSRVQWFSVSNPPRYY